MADIPNRAELEVEFARRFARLSSAHRKELKRLLGNPPNVNNLTADFWERVAAELNNLFLPFLSDVTLDSAERMIGGLPIGVDWALVNRGAVAWARQYSYDLIRGINATSQAAVREAVGNFFEQGLTLGDVDSKLARIFGPVRAEMIAVTEITRAASEGEQQIARELAAQGIQMVPVWQTNNDEIVQECPICWPRHDKEIEDGVYPPAHPRCRCWVNHELPKVHR